MVCCGCCLGSHLQSLNRTLSIPPKSLVIFRLFHPLHTLFSHPSSSSASIQITVVEYRFASVFRTCICLLSGGRFSPFIPDFRPSAKAAAPPAKPKPPWIARWKESLSLPRRVSLSHCSLRSLRALSLSSPHLQYTSSAGV